MTQPTRQPSLPSPASRSANKAPTTSWQEHKFLGKVSVGCVRASSRLGHPGVGGVCVHAGTHVCYGDELQARDLPLGLTSSSQNPREMAAHIPIRNTGWKFLKSSSPLHYLPGSIAKIHISDHKSPTLSSLRPLRAGGPEFSLPWVWAGPRGL